MDKIRFDVRKGGLIGLMAEVSGSKNSSDIGIRGKIVDETKNTILIESKKERKRLFKKNVTLTIIEGGHAEKVEGTSLLGRPKERIKK